MAGHSKWANTKHRKAAQDAKRDKIFTKLIRELMTAAKLGGSDLSSNPRLRAVADKAFSYNMPRDTVNKAILRGLGGNGTAEEVKTVVVYEGYVTSGVAVIVKCLSTNNKRTVAEIRHAFTKCGGHLATNGSVRHLFRKQGVICFVNGNIDAILEIGIEEDIENIVSSNNTIIIYTKWEKLNSVHQSLKKSGLNADSVNISMIPSIKIQLDEDSSLKLLRLTDMLKNCDGVQEVYHNGKISHKIC